MSAPLLWIIVPALVGGILYFLSRWERVTIWVGVILVLFLAFAARLFAIGTITSLGPIRFELVPSFEFFGRRLLLTPDLQPLLMFIYFLAAFWFGGVYAARSGRLTVPLGLGVISLLVAALAVQPFLYAALFIEMAVLLCVPLIVQPGSRYGRGVLRFVTFQTFGMPFILFTGYLLAGIESNPGDLLLTMRVGILMGLGFSFLLAIFPFHTWLPMLGETSHPYLAAFVFVVLPQLVMLFGIGFLERYAWLQNLTAVFVALRIAGLLMILTGSFWAIFQFQLGRVLGYAAMLETGYALLALSMMGETADGLWLHFSLLPARTMALGMMGLTLSVLRTNARSLSLDRLRGMAYQWPFASVGLLLALLTLAGFPLLAAFPPRFAMITDLAARQPNMAWLALLGGIGFFVIALRTFTTLFWREDEFVWHSDENRSQRLLIILGILGLIVLGLTSNWILPWLQNLSVAFPLLGG